MRKPFSEVGVTTAHPIIIIYKSLIGILRTWRYAHKMGLPSNRWYGVYETGTEIVLAHMGCLPGAKDRAMKLSAGLNHQANVKREDLT